MRLADSVGNHEKYLLTLSQFLQQNNQDFQTSATDQNGQESGGIVLAQHLPSRFHAYQLSAPIAPHVGDLPSQPSAVTYDGPLNLTAASLPNGVNSTYGYSRWTGYINPPTPALYTFHLKSAGGGSNLFINKQQLVGALTANSVNQAAQIQLGGGPVPIVTEFQYGTEDPALSLMYSVGGGTPALVPNSWLSNSVNQMTGYLVGYHWNGNRACYYP
jgi:hypothetical protein